MEKYNFKEKVNHGSSMFPMEIYTLRIGDIINSVGCHWHDEIEFLLITEGRAVFHIEDCCYEACAGQVIIVNSGEMHAVFLGTESKCTAYALVFNPCFLFSSNYDSIQAGFFSPLSNKQLYLPAHISGNSQWQKEIFNYLSQIVDKYLEKKDVYELFIKAKLYLVFFELISNNADMLQKKVHADTYKTERLKKVIQYINTHYSEKITVAKLSALVNMSEGQFYRFFKQMLRKTPVEYLNDYRINRAAELLQNNDKKIFEIALDVGFEHFSYFIKSFKKHFNCTPVEYRKKYMTSDNLAIFD